MPTALIKFTQGALIGNPGEALAGVPGVLVKVENNYNVGVQSWRINLVYVPPGSSVPVASPLAQNAASNTPYATFIPTSVPGSYRLQLFVYSGTGFSGSSQQDIRNFVVPDPVHGIVYPPYQMMPPKLPLSGTSEANAKPDELNLGGQPYGWDGYGNEGLLLQFMRKVVAGDFGAGGGSSFKLIPSGASRTIQRNELTLLDGRSTVTGYLKLDGHMRVVGRRHHQVVLPPASGDMIVPNNCVLPVDLTNGPITLTLKNRGAPGDEIEIVSLSDSPTPPVITVNGNGPLLSGHPTRQITTAREYLRLRRRKGHGHLVM